MGDYWSLAEVLTETKTSSHRNLARSFVVWRSIDFTLASIGSLVLLFPQYPMVHTFLLKYRKETWAESCYFADRTSIESSLQNIPLHPLVGLSFFLTGRYQSLAINPFQADSTIQKLYSIAKEIFEKSRDFLFLSMRANDQIEQGLSYLRANTLDSNTEAHIELSLMGASSILSKFQQKHAPTSSEASPSPSPSPSPSHLVSSLPPQSNNVDHQEPQVQSSAEDNQWTFVKNYIASHKSNTRTNNKRVPVPWEVIYRDGRARGYFSTFTSASSMRTSFYRQKNM
ncbi:uncharacterized protein EV154DRAFT_548109 [Mucor mucedo]|uniref:uncharacterized protein n=1 Tax=Mucor mucedo TaxID=29922 RepID=UPI00221EBEF0|nr:uncharacterized protein EV154DRAFT_548109 [Mucor mucedo]KAI7895783.1 hypothetical protein EV154DRAFT_548109 [Mucor mucedo]